MARVPGTPTTASVGSKTMTRTIQCPQCGVVLNVPEAASGRRLKCPHCSSKFQAPSFDPGGSAIAGPSPASSLFPTGRGPGSSGSVELPTLTAQDASSGSVELPRAAKAKGGYDFDLPTSAGPLRETFDLPLLSDGPSAKPSPAARPEAPAVADVLGLFQDEPKSNRKPRGAEARANPRRCTSCSNVVPAGMSLCSRCGLDLDTGRRVAPLEIVEEAEIPESYRPAMPPLGLLFVGSVTAAGFLLLSLASLIAWSKGMDGVQYLMMIWMFGLYASIQFLRRKTMRPLFVALSLAAAIGGVSLIVMPIYDANMAVAAPPINPRPTEPIDPDAPDIRPLTEHLDLNKITLGIGCLLTYAALGVYLNTPGLRRHFRK